jgi:hypothetical protein
MLRAVAANAPDVFITRELGQRPPGKVNSLREKIALQELSALMVEDPEKVLPRFVTLAMEVADGISAGLSLYEERPAPGIFRWHHLVGTLAQFAGATTPRNNSPWRNFSHFHASKGLNQFDRYQSYDRRDV